MQLMAQILCQASFINLPAGKNVLQFTLRFWLPNSGLLA
jgi:hypothetical protein